MYDFLQVIKMLLTIIGIFLFCWGPKLILNIMKRHKLGYILHKNVAFYIMVCSTLVFILVYNILVFPCCK